MSDALHSNVVNGIDISEHQGLVHKIAKRFRWALSSGLCYEDLVQAGNMGLMRAAEKFDPERGFTFATYAVWWVRAQVRREAADRRATVRTPCWRQAEIWSKREPLPAHAVSLDSRMSEDGTTFLDLTPHPGDDPELSAVRGQAGKISEKLLSALDSRHQYVLRRRYLFGDTLLDVGKQLGVTRERARQIEVAALAKLRVVARLSGL